VAVTTALVTKSTAKATTKPATVRRAFRARMTDTHVFYAARNCRETAAANYAFQRAHTIAVDNLNAT
jgi:hypothetical protein